MTEFIVGNTFRRWARRHQPVRDLLWRLDYLMFWLLVKIALILPTDTASRFGERLGKIVGPMSKRKSAIYKANMSTAFPDLSDAEIDQLVKRAWGRAGRVLLEYPHLGKILAEDDRLLIDIREPIETYENPSKPCVIVTAHQSNWEVVCSAMAKLGMPNASLYSPPTNPLLDRLLLDSRKALNSHLLPRDQGARMLMRALKEGQTAAMVMDRRVEDGKPVAFFGYDKPSTMLPARLALKFGCDMVPVQVERLEDAHFRVTFHPPISPRNPGASENEQATDMIQQVHVQFEGWIRQHPQDWFCSKRIWPKGKIRSVEDGRGANAD